MRPRLPARATWGALFGVVPDRGVRRRPSDVARLVTGVAVVVVGAVGARRLSRFERLVHDVVTAVPDPVLEGLRILNGGGALVTGVLVAVAALASRRLRFVAGVAAAAAVTWAVGTWLRGVVDAPAAVGSVVGLTGPYPEFPSLRMAVLAAVFFVAAPELTRPARRLLWLLLVGVAVSVLAVTDGYPAGLLGSLALGWAVAAAVHLALGSPDGVPEPASVRADAVSLGIDIEELAESRVQVWGEQAYDAADADGPLRVVVVGRDATDAQLLAKLFRFVWYKDAGPVLVASRRQHIEHRAYLLMRAQRAGVEVPSVLADGAVGGRRDAMVVLRDRPGRALDEVAADELTDAVLDAAWAQLGALHACGLSHQGIAPAALRLSDDGRVAFVDLATSDPDPADDAVLADRAALLVTTASLTDDERAVAAAERALGRDDLATVLPLLQLPALPRALRRSVPDVKALAARLRSGVADATGTEVPKLVELRRVSLGDIAMAVGALLGVYLLIGQLSEVDFSTVFDDADWAWLPVVALFSQTPQLASAVAVLGSVAQPLPLRPVVGLQFANNFTGLVGGGVANTALVVRFFQRQGMGPAVAISSGLLTSIAAGVLQALFVGVGLLFVGDEFTVDRSGGGGAAGIFVAVVLVVAAVSGVVLLVPRLRSRIGGVVVPQLRSGWENLRTVLVEPKKGLQLFGGNLLAQVFFALTLWAALETYGEPVGLLELVIINSLASVIGGLAPVPGGMGVIEAGLIGGFTAAGVPQDQAVAATFTARLFTAYLPPVWGWFALAWLRRREYV